MSFRFRDPPNPTEIFSRRGKKLTLINTKCFDEPLNGEQAFQVAHINLPLSAGACQDKDLKSSKEEFREISRWSSTTEGSDSEYSEPETDSEVNNQETYEERLNRHRDFFDNRPLMRCLDEMDDNLEDVLLADLHFERLLREVQKPGLPFETSTEQFWGEMQVRSFWDNVRRQLHVHNEKPLEDEWPEGYTEHAERLQPRDRDRDCCDIFSKTDGAKEHMI